MDTRYMTNAFIAILIGIFIQYFSIKSDNRIVVQEQLSQKYSSLGAQLQSNSLNPEAKAAVYTEFIHIEEALIKEGDMILRNFITMSWIHFILSSYLLQNILQYIFAKLRRKNMKIVIPELILNLLCSLITFYILAMYY